MSGPLLKSWLKIKVRCRGIVPDRVSFGRDAYPLRNDGTYLEEPPVLGAERTEHATIKSIW